MSQNNYVRITQGRRTIGTLLAILFSLSAWAQSYTVKGKVTDTNGQPIPGATIQVAGTTLGTVANVEGEFTISVSGNVKLNFSAVSYSSASRDVTSSQSVVNISLREDQMNLDEVIVTGSTIRAERRQLGNAITTIKADNLEKTGTPNLISALQGKVPGAQITQNSGDPAGGLSVRLRGISSISSSSDPLYYCRWSNCK